MKKRRVKRELAWMLIGVAPYMKLDHSIFCLKEMVLLYEIYLDKHAVENPETGNKELPEEDPMRRLEKTVNPLLKPVYLVDFLLHFCEPLSPTADVAIDVDV